MKKAYDNWHQVIEYDGKALLNSKQTRRTRSSQNELTMNTINYSNPIDSQLALPRLPVAVSSEQGLLENNVVTPGKLWVNFCLLYYRPQVFRNLNQVDDLQRRKVRLPVALLDFSF